MSFFNEIKQPHIWIDFLDNESEKVMPDKKLIRDVEKVIKEESYLNYDTDFFSNFAIPKFVQIPKHNTKKTRDVFVYPKEYNIILKLLAFYLLNHYNKNFAKNSLAYTRGRGVKTAFSKLSSFRLKPDELVYKNDFSDYFNSIDLDILKEKLKDFFRPEDLEVKQFIIQILSNPKAYFKGKVQDFPKKGVMAGSPISGILANIYMHEIDLKMIEHNHRYIRYADDTLIVGQDALDYFKEQLKELNIIFNQKKEEEFTLREGIVFLGFLHKGKVVDISPEARDKMKSRMKRRAKWYRKWMLKNNVPKYITLRHYVKGINKKLYTQWDDSINWSLWYLPNINTTKTIKWLDDYFVNCIRYLDSGTWRRGRKYYNLQYTDIKKLGFKSLLNTYYRLKRGKDIYGKL